MIWIMHILSDFPWFACIIMMYIVHILMNEMFESYEIKLDEIRNATYA